MQRHHPRFKHRPSALLATLFLAGSVLDACSVVSKSSPGPRSIADVKPADASGAIASVSLSFGSLEAATKLALAEDKTTASEIKIGNSMTITDARLSIAAIKIKSEKEVSDAEKAKDAQDIANEQQRLAREEGNGVDAHPPVASTLSLKPDEDNPGKGQGKPSETPTAAPTVQGSPDKSSSTSNEQKKAEQDAELEKTQAEDSSVKWKGPFVYDLIKQTVSPEISQVEIPDGTYHRVEFQLKPNRDVAQTDPLLNNVMFIAGTVFIDGKTVPFKLSYHVSENVRLTGIEGVKLEASMKNELMIAFDIESWFAGIDFAKATKEADGSIVIDKNHNHDLLMVLKKLFKESTQFGKNEDSDKILKPEEAKGDGLEHAQDPAPQS